MIFNKDKIDLVIYHGNCHDGFGSAFIIWYYYKSNFGIDRANQIKYYAAKYVGENETVDLDTTDKNVIMVDFSYKKNMMKQIIDSASSFMVLDHHKTAQADLEWIDTSMKIFDMSRSGIGITWDFFFDAPLPIFLAHLQDRDLWTYKIPNTNEFCIYFFEQEFKFEIWEKMFLSSEVDEAIAKGKNWLEYQNKIISKTCDYASYVIHKFKNQLLIALYVNSPNFKSDIGNQVFNKYPFGDFSVVWHYDLWKNNTSISLRSTNDRYDVSIIAKEFGGGGHRNASGLGYDGCVGSLKLEIVKDYDLLVMIKNSKIVDINKDKAVILTGTLAPELEESLYLDLIKRKFNQCFFIIFCVNSDKIDYNEATQEVTHLTKYIIYYNIQALKDKERTLAYYAIGQENSISLEFEFKNNVDEFITFFTKSLSPRIDVLDSSNK